MAQRNILVVVDEALVLEDIRECLTGLGYEVATATRGEEALRKAREITPSLILMDIALRGELDGIAVAEEIHTGVKVPVIFLTAFSDEATLARAKVTEPYGFLTKPFSQQDLRAAIETAIYKHGREKNLQDNEERFRLLYEHTPAAYQLLDGEGRVVECNTQCLDLLGVTRDQIIGQRFSDLLAPSAREEFLDRLLRCKISGNNHGSELEIRKPDGSLAIVSAHVMVRHDPHEEGLRWHCLMHDIGESKAAELALRQSEEKYRALVETLPQGVVIIEGTEVVFLNTAAQRMFRCPAVNPDDRPNVLAFIPEPEKGHLARYTERLDSADQSPDHFITSLLRAEGTRFPAEVHMRRMSYQGRPAVLVIISDITAQKQTQEELIQAQRLAALGEIAAGVAHNFNNLLQIILGSSQLAQKRLARKESEGIALQLDRIVNSVHGGAQIVRHLLLFAGLKSERTLPGQVLDLGSIVRAAIEAATARWRSRPGCISDSVEIVTDIAPSCLVGGCEGELREALSSVLQNALEAVPARGRITLRSHMDDGEAVLHVEDTGPGIPPDQISKVFEPFFTTKGYLRSGMGLAMTYGIVVRHGGRIAVKSEPGGGACFEIRIPVAPG